MTPTEQFIEDAIKGGWRPYWHWGEDKMTAEEIIESITEHKDEWYNNYYNMVVNTNHPFLNPRAWQAVGKTRGWEHCKTCDGSGYTGSEHNPYPCSECGHSGVRASWKQEMHRFIDHIADGKTIDEALQAIS